MSQAGNIVLKMGYGLAVLLGVIGLALLPIGPAIAATGVPKIINYQGRLMDANGVLLGGAGTEYCFKFSLYDNATVGSGTKLWPATSPSTTTASVKNGVFSVGIGDTSVGGDTLDFNFQDTDTVYVQVDVATKVGPTCAFGDGGEVFETLSPRQRIHASGYAINAGTVGGFLAAQYATGNQIPVLSSGSLILGDVNPFINATTSNALTLQGGGQVTGDIQFFSSANKITAAGNATFAGNVTAASSTITNATSTTFFATLGRFTAAIIEILSATVATIINLTTTNFVATNATTTNATTTNLAVTSLANALLSTNAEGTLVATTSISGNYLETTGNWSGLFDGQDGSYYLANSFSTTSATFFADASSTLPKTYSDNVFTGGNVFGNTTTTNATTTNLTVSGLASTSGLIVSNLNSASCDVKANQFGVLSCGTDAVGGGGVDPFPSNATTSLLTFSSGIIAFGSSTIQNLSSSNATVTNATSTSFFSTLARFTTSIVDSLTAAVATITNLTATNATTTNATTTNLYASAVTSLSGLFGNLTATTSVNLASTTAQGRFITGNIVATSTATSSFAGPLSVGTNGASYLVSIVGSTTAPTSATGTAVLAVSNSNNTLSSGTNILRLNQRVGFGTTCTSASTCPRFIEYFAGVPSGSDTGGRGVGSLRLSTAGTGITQTSGAADFAEYMVLNSAASVGDIVSLNSSGEYQLAVAGQSLIGVVSDNPAFVGNANLEGETNAYVVGFAGVIETTVSDANGAISAGDFIAASTTAGIGVKLVGSGFTVGQALEAWSGPGTGQISVLVFPKYIDAAVALGSYGGTQGGVSGYWSLATSTGVISFASSTYSLSLNKFSTTNATTTNLAIQGVTSALLSTDANGRVIATTSLSSNLIDTTGNWTGTLDGYEGNYLIANSFSTSSANFWKNQNNFFSTTSAQFFAAAGLAWSTTSADAWKATNNFFSTSSATSFAQAGLAWSTTSAVNFIDSSSTIPKTYTENVFTSGNTFLNTTTTSATTTNLAVSGTASTSQLVVSNLKAASCDVKATPAGVLICGTDATGTTVQDAFVNGATSTLLTFNAGLITFGSSTVQNLSSSNATITNATTTSFFSTLARFTTGIFNSLTATNLTATNATTTNLAVASLPNTVLTTNSDGTVVATTSISGNYIEKTGNWTGTFDGFEGSYYLANSFSTTSALSFSQAGLAFSTTSNDYWKSVNNFFSTSSSLYFASAGLSFSSTSASYFLLQNQGAAFSTTSAQEFVHTSTTIAKAYSDNTFTGNNAFTQTITGDISGNAGTATALETARTINGVSFDGTSNIVVNAASSSLLVDSNTFVGTNTFTNMVAANATTTNISSTNASTTNLVVSSLNTASCDVKATAAGVLICGTDATGTTVQDAFVNGATSTLLTFNQGLIAFGSSTIQNLNASNATITNATTTSFFSTLARFTTTITDSLTAAVASITSLTSTNFITVNSTSTNATTTNLAITTLPSTVLTTDATGRVVATTSISGNYLDTTGNWSGTFDGREGSDYLANSFSTTSADNWKNNRDFFSTSSANYFSSTGLSWSTTSGNAWKNVNNFFSTTSATYFTSVGLSFSTTSADAWKVSRDFFSTTSSAYFASVGLSFSTTSADAWKTANNFFSTSSAQYLAAVGLSWSTTSANYFAASFIDASTTIPKLYSSNIWTAGNIFGNTTTTNATTTNLSVTGTASTSQLIVSSLNAVNCDVKASALGVLTCGTDSGGIDPFPGNATTSLLTFTSGILVNASSTLGSGAANGGITIAGNATTTGKLIVQGNATSTFAAGIDIASGCFAVNGECISVGGGSGNGVLINIQTFTSPGTTTYTPSAGAISAQVILTGGGGGGGGADAPTADTANETVGGGGGAGATSVYFADLTATTSVQVTVGAGGAAGAISGGAGGNGGWSRFSTFASTTGGSGGGGSAINAACAAGSWGTAGSGGTAAGGNVNINGGSGHIGDCLAEVVFGGLGGASYWGGGGRGGTDPAANGGNPGVAGSAYGSGGGGGANEDTDVGVVGGAGANGIIVIYEYGPYTGVMGIDDGGTGTTTAPTYGQILVGNSLGGYDLVSTSSLGITGGGGGGADPFPGNATNTTLTFNGGLFAAGSSTVENLKGTNATITNATSTSFFSTLARFTTSIVDSLTAAVATITNLTATNATTTNFAVSGLANALLSTNAQGTLVATTSISGNFLEKTGNWTGTFDGQEGNYYIANSFSTSSATYFTSAGLSFSTTSANAWKAVNNFFSTTSAVYFSSAGLAWSTTSAMHFIDASTTIPKTYSSNTFTGSNIFNGTLTLGTFNGPLHANNGVVGATTSIGAVYGGTGQTTYAVGDILYASAANTLTKLSAGANGTVLKLAGGVPTWGTDNSGGGGGAGAWSTSTNDMFLYPADPTDVVVVGNNATTTTTSIFEVIGNSYFSSVVGIGTTSPGTLLSIGNVANFAPTLSTFYSALSLGQLTATSSLTVSGQTTFATASSTAVGALDYLAVGRNGTTTIQGNSTGTSTIKGFINVEGTNSTSTFSGGLAASRIALTSAATSTAVRGFDIASGCFAINGNCIGGVTSVSAANSSVTITPTEGNVQVSLNLANANTWTGLQVFSGASTTAVSALDYVAIGRTSTTTIQGSNTGTSTIRGFINVTGTNSTSTFSGTVAMARASTTATSTLAGIQLSNIRNCTRALETDADGNIGCGTDAGIDGVTVTTFTTSGTWTKSNYTNLSFSQVIVTASGGGGGGADSPDTTNEIAAGAGGAGGTSISMISTGSLGATESVTIGARGTAGANTGTAGGNGNTSSFGSLVSAVGGSGGSGVTANATGCAAVSAIGAGGAGGATTTAAGDIKLAGGDGTPGMVCTANLLAGGDGGASYWGGGGKGGFKVTAGGGSIAGESGDAYGAGGGGAVSQDTTTGAAGGLGGMGVVITMNYTSSGGDLAEWYETMEDVEAGDVVAISEEMYEYDSKLGLQKSAILKKAHAGSSVVGVISTAPFETIGRDVLAKSTHPRPVALAGRVPVKVSDENGIVKAGDRLTVSSIPGVAMRSTKAGITIGQALEDMMCAEEGGTCSVLIMVHTDYSTGALIKVAMRDVGVDMDAIPADLDHGRIILAGMLQQKKDITASTTFSEMSTDRIAAGLEIITPRVVADKLVANVIEPVEKDVSIVLEEDGSFVIGKAEDELSVSFGTASSTFATSVAIDALGNALFAGTLTAANFEVGTEENPGGITMYDRDTRDPYCLLIAGGSLKTVEGKCSSPSAESMAAAANSLFTDTPPVIVVHGENPVHVAVGGTYVDAGATVTDDHDENLTASATVDGKNLEGLELDTSKDTNYTVTYRAVDSRGNIGRAIRTIIVGTGFAPEPVETEEMDTPEGEGEEANAVAAGGEGESAGESTETETAQEPALESPVTQEPAGSPVTQEPAPEPQASAVDAPSGT